MIHDFVKLLTDNPAHVKEYKGNYSIDFYKGDRKRRFSLGHYEVRVIESVYDVDYKWTWQVTSRNTYPVSEEILDPYRGEIMRAVEEHDKGIIESKVNDLNGWSTEDTVAELQAEALKRESKSRWWNFGS